MLDQNPQQSMKSPVGLALVLVFAGVAALSIHVGMLLAGVPFPVASPPAWAGWLNQAVTTITLLVVVRLAGPMVARLSLVKRTLLIFLVLAMIRETVRGIIMNGVVTTSWAFALVALPDQILRLLFLAALVAIGARWTTNIPRLVVIGLAIAGASFGMNKIIAAATSPLAEQLAHLARPDAYTFPYPAEVMVPAYLTLSLIHI